MISLTDIQPAGKFLKPHGVNGESKPDSEVEFIKKWVKVALYLFFFVILRCRKQFPN